MNESNDWIPSCTKFADWPQIDRTLWAAGCTAETPFDVGGHGATLRPDSLRKVQKGYGVWLCFLAARGELDPTLSPAERLTRARASDYFQALKNLGRSGHTILGRFGELRLAMKIMAPDADTAWLLRPRNVSLRSIIRPHSRSVVVPDSAVAFRWGLDLMEKARSAPPSSRQNSRYRDGLMIALFAARARRLRSMALIRVGKELRFCDGRFYVELTEDQVKTGKPDRFSVPDSLTAAMHHYLNVVRPALLGESEEDALWISAIGTRLSERAIQAMLARRSKRRFGVAFSAHRFRHMVATTLPLRRPDRPGLGAAVLGVSKQVVEQHYYRAGQILSAINYEKILAAYTKDWKMRRK
ncbi:tyrosine-type recombinase/integrase [Acidiphilium sp. JA12-A1]|uniref:tyrosine-type recombinase/integrase n=1 Tax=Acidiphilium sp. JA12-A1 TaxID=1464546 RepID=UPI0004613AD4|nr:tyrosine-type recombinase/integrase [Acidiphilium sp. JA12-A1]KDM68272.1 site-specific recombinase XerD [Acidiphilium sp. JA12-A1]